MVNLNINLDKLPLCPKCQQGEMLPFWDFTYATETKEATLFPKGWACNFCGHNMFLVKGNLVEQAVSGGLSEQGE